MTVRCRLTLRWVGASTVAILVIAAGMQIHDRALPSLAASTSGRLVGAFHMHTSDSHDSEVTVEEYAAAARQNNLDFLILTDHNVQKPSALSVAGVTVLSYAELSTSFGHVVGLGASYTVDRTLREDPAVLRHISAAGGAPIITHPSDFKRPWEGDLAGAAGLEIANLAAAARRRAPPALLGMLPLLTVWPLNAPLALAQLIDRDEAALARWDANPEPLFVGLCGTDAHGWIPLRLNLRAWYVVIDLPTPPDNRAASILAALRAGTFHCACGLFGRDPTFAFGARKSGHPAGHPGDTVRIDGIDELVVTAPSSSIGPSQIVLLRDGKEISRAVGSTLRLADPEPGTYRAEIRILIPNLLLGNRWETAIYSNRLRVARPEATPAGGPIP